MTRKEPFEEAVKRHGSTIARVCRAVLGYGPDADDAWSETFLAAMRAWPELGEEVNVEAWLVRVAQRKAIDITRRRARQAIATADVPEPVPVVPVRAQVESEPLIDEHDLWQAVAVLPERQRLAVAYHYFGGLSHAETAELIGGTAAAVRRASSDGIKNLRRTFERRQC